MTGIFVARKARAVSLFSDVAVLTAIPDPTLHAGKYEFEYLIENGIPTVRVYFAYPGTPIWGNIVYNFRYFLSLLKGWKLLKARWGKPDVIHTNIIDRAGYFGLFLKIIRGIPYVITEHSTPDVDFAKGLRKETILPVGFLKRFVIMQSAAVNVDSTTSLRYFEKVGCKGKFSVIPNVVDVVSIPAERKSGKRQGKKIGVHISILNERKNVTDIIRASSNLYHKTGMKNFELHILGDGQQKETLIRLTKELGLFDKCIFFHGYVEEKEKIAVLQNADFHVLNSDEEGFSVVTAEAISLGVPVIATKCGGPEDFVTDEVGILIERRDLSALENALRYMIENSEHYDRKRLIEIGRERFSPEVVGLKTVEWYRDSITRWTAGNTSAPLTINPQWVVLDVGSGHQPNHRANVLLERYLKETEHRTVQKVEIPRDKQMVVGDALRQPFKDKSFDFVIASHIAEHIPSPEEFCRELQRVGKRGYIETPGPLTEWLLPTQSHKWIVNVSGKTLTFRTNPFTHPPSKTFFRFFYLNREGYTDTPLMTKNIFIIGVNLFVVSIWKYLPYTYARLHWDGNFECVARIKKESVR